MNNSKKFWYAAYTKSRHEKFVEERLQQNGIETFLPLVKERKQWKDRKKDIEIPLIKSYIFFYVEPHEIYYVIQTQGIVNIVKIGDEYTKIPEYQIELLKLVLEKRMVLTAECCYTKGDNVQVVSGPLKGKVGEILQIRGKTKLILNIDSIGFVFSTPILFEDVKKIKPDSVVSKVI